MAGNLYEMRAPLVILLIAALDACGTSPPVRFYTLDPIQTGAEGAARAEKGAPVQVAAVHLPRTLDRREMVRQSAPNQLTISSEHRWGAPLGAMTREVLTQDLNARLREDRVVLPDSPAPPGTLAIVLDLLRFERDASGSVVLEGSFSVFAPEKDTPLARRAFHLTEPSGSGDFADQARAMSALLGRLADQIARALP